MNSFLQYVARDMLAKHPEGLNDVAVVFPNKRASLFFNQALCDEVGKPLWSPAYIAISDLFRRHSELQVPDPIQLVFRLYNVFCEVTDSCESLDHFYSWGQLLLADFDDLDKNMADADKLFINLEAWQELKDFSFLTEAQRQSLEDFFGKVMDDTEMQQRFNDVWRHLGTIYHRYRQSLEADGLAYEGMLYRRVVQSRDIDFHYRHYIFVGFNLLQKVEQRLFRRLKEEGRAEFYWDYDEAFVRDNHEAGRHIAANLDKFPNELSPQRISAGLSHDEIYTAMSVPKDIAYISAPTENIQARYVAEWLRQNGRIADGSRTVIVLGNENLLETVVHCLPDEVKDVNITTGYPLASSPVGTLVNALIDLQLHGHTDHSDNYRLRQVAQVLRHPYAKYISADCSALLQHLAAHNLHFPSRRQLTEGYGEALGELFTTLQPTDGRLPLLGWVAGLLKRVGIHSRDTDDPLMHEAIFRMYTLVNRLDSIMIPVAADTAPAAAGVDPKSGRQLVSLSILQRLMSQVVQSTTIPFHGEPLLGIQVMGVLETRNLDFDHVLLLSCNEGNLPKSVNDASFIPHSLRAGYELTTVENKVSIYAYYFYALLQRAGDITLAYNNSTDDGHKGEMSRFMLQLMVENHQRHRIRYGTLLSGQQATLIQRRPIEKTNEVQERLLGIPNLSPSAISRYLRCPLQFYYSSVCRLREDAANKEDEIDNVTFGNIFHRAAELVHLHLSHDCRQQVTAEGIARLLKDKTQLDALIDRAFRNVLLNNDDAGPRMQYNGLQRLNKKVIRLYVERLLALDRQLAPFDILALEQSFHDKLTFTVNGRSHTVDIGGQIDRLDRITRQGQSVIRVVDYKTGSPLSARPGNIEEIFNPKNVDTKHSTYYLQAFLYAGIIRHGTEVQPQVNPEGLAVAPALFFIRQSATEDYDPTLTLAPPKGKREAVTDIDTKYDEFMAALRTLVAEIFNPVVPFNPTADGKHCINCPYNSICGL